MRGMTAVILMICLGIGTVSCTTIPVKDVAYFPVELVVEAETEVIYEVYLDSELILSNKYIVGSPVTERFRAKEGRHILVVTAEGHDKWQRTIGLISDEEQHFYVELEKTKIRIPSVAR